MQYKREGDKGSRQTGSVVKVGILSQPWAGFFRNPNFLSNNFMVCLVTIPEWVHNMNRG